MFWNSRKAVPVKNAGRKNRKLRLETVEERQMLNGGPLGHVLYGAIGPIQHEPIGPALYGPISPGRHEHFTQPVLRMPIEMDGTGAKQALAEDHGLNHPDRQILSSPAHHRAGMSASITTEEKIRPRSSDLFVQETVRVSSEVEKGGVTQVTIDVTEDVYSGGKGGRLLAEEDVQVVADIQGTGNLQIDVNESESVAARSGRGMSTENLVENVEVNVDIRARAISKLA